MKNWITQNWFKAGMLILVAIAVFAYSSNQFTKSDVTRRSYWDKVENQTKIQNCIGGAGLNFTIGSDAYSSIVDACYKEYK